MSIISATVPNQETASPSLPSLPLSSAVLCVDCDRITVSYNSACPLCGGRSLLNVAQILGGALGPERVRPGEPRLTITRCA
jgi:hypothetical protein